MWLILADDNDHSAHWLYQRLQRRGLHTVQVVSAAAVAYNLFWNYRMSNERSDVEFAFGDGRRLKTDSISGILNRLTAIPTDTVRASFLAGHAHTQREQMAYFVSWIYGLPVPVINRPSIHSLNGEWQRSAEWTTFARLAGLTLAPFCQSAATSPSAEIVSAHLTPFEMPLRTIYVMGGHVVGDEVPKTVADGCLKLANMTKREMLGLEFVVHSPRSWLLAGVNAFPDLQSGGELLVDAVLAYVRQFRWLDRAAC